MVRVGIARNPPPSPNYASWSDGQGGGRGSIPIKEYEIREGDFCYFVKLTRLDGSGIHIAASVVDVIGEE